MNREIKFRAWQDGQMCEIDGNSKVTLEFNDISGWNIVKEPSKDNPYYLMGESSKGGKDFVLMQFTGLKDKNGKEIYDGDIINIPAGNKYDPIKGEHYVKWDLTGWFIRRLDGIDYIDIDYSELLLYNFVVVSEVIGNIYENPESLNE